LQFLQLCTSLFLKFSPGDSKTGNPYTHTHTHTHTHTYSVRSTQVSKGLKEGSVMCTLTRAYASHPLFPHRTWKQTPVHGTIQVRFCWSPRSPLPNNRELAEYHSSRFAQRLRFVVKSSTALQRGSRNRVWSTSIMIVHGVLSAMYSVY